MLLPDPWNEIQSFKKPPIKKSRSFKKPTSKKPVSFRKTPSKTPTSFKKPPSFKKPVVPSQEGFNPMRWFQQKFSNLDTSQQNPKIKVNLNSNQNSVRIKPDISDTVKIAPEVKKTGGFLASFGTPLGIASALSQIPSGQDQSMKWSRLGYPSPEAYQAVVRGDRHKLSVDGVMYDMRNEAHKKMMNLSIDKAIAAQQKALKEDKVDGDGGGNGGRGREKTTRRNINDVEQRGTVLSPMAGANQMLENLGVTTQRYGKFQSNNLPGSTYSPEVEKALSKIYDTETLHRFDGSVNDLELSEDLFMDGSGVKGAGPFYAADVNYDEINPINMLQAEGSPFLVRNGGFSATDQVNPKNKNGTRARYDQEFLNSGNDVIGGLRAADRSKGLLYASGKYWRENPNAGQEGEKDYFEIKKDEYKAIKNSDMGAQDFLSSKLEQTKQTFKPDLTDQSDAVRDAVGLTADPYTFTAEGPSDERSTRLGEYMLGKIDDINPKPTLRR
jgi:hypothetical protein